MMVMIVMIIIITIRSVIKICFQLRYNLLCAVDNNKKDRINSTCSNDDIPLNIINLQREDVALEGQFRKRYQKVWEN